MVRSDSLPDLRRTHREVPIDAISSRSLPADLHSIEPTYSEIPDHVAAAQRPLPEAPHTYWQIPDHLASAQRPLPHVPCTYDEIPDDVVLQVRRSASIHTVTRIHEVVKDDNVSCKSAPAALHSVESVYWKILNDDDDNDDDGPILPYAATAEISLSEVKKRRENAQPYRQNSQNQRSSTSRQIIALGLDRMVNTQRVTFYEQCPCGQYERANITSRNIFGDPTTDHDVRTYVNATDASGVPSVSHAVGSVLSTPSDTYWPWCVPTERPRSKPRRASLPALPDSHWSSAISREGPHNTPLRTPLTISPNTYWPWEYPRRWGSGNTPPRATLTTLPLPNTYWPWEI
uniref:Uncharacterized protein n=1 Tax=Branchiostoma floridae TaxID=7739 RepID=C3YCA4_BRAFL|eukprot:XP_002606126.1 hypothetical protein BRAFLDRAFT_88037 [Branchiostoma floridae]